MKAVDYAARLKRELANPPLKSAIFSDVPKDEDGPADREDIVLGVCFDLLKEGSKLAETRRAQTPEAYAAVIREQEQKWRAIVARVGDSEISELTFTAFVRAYDKAHPPRGKTMA